MQLSRKGKSGPPGETRTRHPQHDAVARCCLPHCVTGLSDGNLAPHKRSALLEDCLVVLRVRLADEDVEIDWGVVEMRYGDGVGVLVEEYAAMSSHPLEDNALYAGCRRGQLSV